MVAADEYLAMRPGFEYPYRGCVWRVGNVVYGSALWPNQCWDPGSHAGRRIQAKVLANAKHTRVINHRPHTVGAFAHPMHDAAKWTQSCARLRRLRGSRQCSELNEFEAFGEDRGADAVGGLAASS